MRVYNCWQYEGGRWCLVAVVLDEDMARAWQDAGADRALGMRYL